MSLIQLQLRPAAAEHAAEVDPEIRFVFTSGAAPRPCTLFLSVAAHLVAIGLISAYSRYISNYFEDEIPDGSHYRLEMLRLHVTEPLYFRPNATPAAAHRQQRGNSRGQTNQVVEPPFRAFVAPDLELPPPTEHSSGLQAIIQPEEQALSSPALILPPIAFWDRRDNSFGPTKAEDAIVAGRTEMRPPSPDLTAPPSLEVPNRNLKTAEINVALASNPSQPWPAAPLPNSATIPVRLRSGSESQAATFESSPGQAANLIVMSKQQPRSELELPRGLSDIPEPGSGRRPDNSDTGHRTARSSGATGRNGTTAAPGSNGPLMHRPDRIAETGGEYDTPQSARFDLAYTSERPARDSVHRGGASQSAEVTRIKHTPNGRADIVITQSAARDDLPEVGRILSSSPVYTVYLAVGDRKEWLLQYCVKPAENALPELSHIQIDAGARLTPPYPLSTAIPATLRKQLLTEMIVLHGFLTTSGDLKNMTAVEAGNPLATQVLTFLDEWQFRPALRRNKPIDIEVVLIIPART